MSDGRFGKLRYKPPGDWVQATALLEVAGLHHREDAARAFLAAVREAERQGWPYTIALQPEPTNIHDPNAIRIYGVATERAGDGEAKAGKWHIGYVDRETAAEVQEEFTSRGIPIGAELYDIEVEAQYIHIRYFVLAPPGNSHSTRMRRQRTEEARISAALQPPEARPAQPSETNDRKTGMSTGAGCLTIIVLGIVLLWLLGRNSSDDAALKNPCEQDTAAYVMAQSFVESRLKAPKSAEFPWMSDDRVKVVRKEGCKFTVYGYVDAQNSFGAQIRSNFVVDLGPEPIHSDNWRATRVEIHNR